MADIPDSHRDLLDTAVATLATLDPDGRPQLTEVWFLYDGEFRVSLNTSRRKVRNLRRDPRCALFVLDLANPYRYLEIRGDAALSPDGDYDLADRVGAKYGGADLRERDRPGESRVAVTVRPVKINAVDMSA